MKRISAAGLFVVAVVIGAALARHYSGIYVEVDPPSIRLSPTIPPYYEYEQNCERVQQILADSPSGEPILKTAPLSEDEIAIYKVVLGPWDSRSPINLSSRTFPLHRDISQCECLDGIEPASIIGASNTFHVLRRKALSSRNLRFVDSDSQNYIIQVNDPARSIGQGESVKNAVDKAFKSGLFSLSEIAFNKEQSRALVSYSFHCGLLCGSGGTWVLEKVNGVWKKSSDHTCTGWIS